MVSADTGRPQADEAQQTDVAQRARAQQNDQSQQRGDTKQRADAQRRTETSERTDARRTETPERTVTSQRTDTPERADTRDKAETRDRTAQPQHRATTTEHHDGTLFEDREVERFREQWRELQSGFVDEPKSAVREADSLVSQMMDTFTAQLTERRRALTGAWDGDVDTEELRVALRRYRVLFDQMLAVK